MIGGVTAMGRSRQACSLPEHHTPGDGTLGVVADAADPTRLFDFDDLLDLPDDTLRHEVVERALIVNAAPSWQHQRTADRLSDCSPTPPHPAWKSSRRRLGGSDRARCPNLTWWWSSGQR